MSTTKLFVLFAILCAGITSCYDDTYLREQLADHELRIASLEALCIQMNTNISSLQVIVDALEKQDHIISTAPIMKEDKSIGYTITFASGNIITIYHGQDGEDGQNGQNGHSPIIGVKCDVDGIYYWTLDGEWVLDSNGKKIRATAIDGEKGEDGKDGVDGSDGIDAVIPKLKIDNGYWYVSYDSGITWFELYKAVGEDGDAFFKSVVVENHFVAFTLMDGSSIVIPKKNDQFDVIFVNTEGILCSPGEILRIPFNVVGATDTVSVECIGNNGWIANAEMFSNLEGEIVINVPWYVEYGKVLVFATNGNEQVVMKCLTFQEKMLVLVSDLYNIDEKGGSVCVPVITNLDYEISIPHHAQSWITRVETKATTGRVDSLKFDILPNTTEYQRSAEVMIISKDSLFINPITINQRGYPKYLSDKGTANCYIAPPNFGRYSFDASVKGNANNSSGTIDVKLEGGNSAKIVWAKINEYSDTQVISDIDYDEKNQRISFSTSGVEGNALVALCNNTGEVIWSWHIWVTEYKPELSAVTFASGAVLQDRDLGSFAASMDGFNDDDKGLFYQWGRKDPFYPNQNKYLHPAETDTVTIQYSVANPDIYIYYSWDWNSEHTSVWDPVKTIYDPCPQGWKVMDSIDSLIPSWPEGYVAPIVNKSYLTLSDPICSPAIKFNINGFLHVRADLYSGFGMIWTNRGYIEEDGYMGPNYLGCYMDIRADLVTEITSVDKLINACGRCYGQNVRCQKE